MSEKLREVFPPCSFIVEEMEARGWSPETLAEKMSVKMAYLEPVLQNKMRVTKGCAYALGRAFDTSGEYWENLQRMWDESGG